MGVLNLMSVKLCYVNIKAKCEIKHCLSSRVRLRTSHLPLGAINMWTELCLQNLVAERTLGSKNYFLCYLLKVSRITWVCNIRHVMTEIESDK
jgi:hypothetical protein